MPTLRPLVLTGGPAAGKTTIARGLVAGRRRAAHLDVDDLRQLVINSHAPPWDGAEGTAQHRLGVRNTAALAGNFSVEGYEVVISDVITTPILALYRQLLPQVFVLRLAIDLGEARVREATRTSLITAAEFEMLHDQQRQPLAVDAELDVSTMSFGTQLTAVQGIWLRHSQ